MAMSNEQILIQEIDNLKTLLVKVDEGIDPLDALTEQKQKVLDILPGISPESPIETDPIHRLLSCEPLTNTEIPLDVLEISIESGFDVNARVRGYSCMDSNDYIYRPTCLNLAIKNGHYSAVRYLVQHGADCEIGSIEHKLEYNFDERYESEPNDDSDDDCDHDDEGIDYREDYYVGEELESNYREEYFIFKRQKLHKRTPIAELALKANAPLDLFDVLATPRSLTNNGDNKHLPLHLALQEGHKENALRLIKLGADVNLKDHRDQLPIQLYERNLEEYHDELFIRLIPSDTVAILQCVNTVFLLRDQMLLQSKMIHRLFQNMTAADHLHVQLMRGDFITMMINNERFSPLDHDFASKDAVQVVHKIQDIWNTNRDTVLSLQSMCIHQARRCMRDFSDESFASLPVPNTLRKWLMYQHVAELACEAVKCMKYKR